MFSGELNDSNGNAVRWISSLIGADVVVFQYEPLAVLLPLVAIGGLSCCYGFASGLHLLGPPSFVAGFPVGIFALSSVVVFFAATCNKAAEQESRDENKISFHKSVREKCQASFFSNAVMLTFSSSNAGNSLIGTRCCCMVSRSRSVTVLSASVSWSTVMQ